MSLSVAMIAVRWNQNGAMENGLAPPLEFSLLPAVSEGGNRTVAVELNVELIAVDDAELVSEAVVDAGPVVMVPLLLPPAFPAPPLVPPTPPAETPTVPLP